MMLRRFIGLFKRSSNNVIDKVVGTDHLGNVYHERVYTNSEGQFKRKRWIEMIKERKNRNIYKGDEDEDVKIKEYTMFDIPKVPPLWEGWLRGRREKPPNKEDT